MFYLLLILSVLLTACLVYGALLFAGVDLPGRRRCIRLQDRTALALERLSRAIRPVWTIPRYTTQHVLRFHELLRDVGLDRLYDEDAHETQPQGPMTAVEAVMGQAREVEAHQDIDPAVLHEMRVRFMDEGHYEDLVCIVLDIAPHRVRHVPVDVVEAALGHFMIAYARHTLLLVGMQINTASDSMEQDAMTGLA